VKTIGLIGGMSWESTQTYYRLINQKVREQLGGLHSVRLVLCTNTMHKVAPFMRSRRSGMPCIGELTERGAVWGSFSE
jgi:aspartate racemase